MAESKDQCCPKGSAPELKINYNEKGKEDKIDDLSIYVVEGGDRAIIGVSDIFGFRGGRTRQMCDQFADAGFFVVLPDFLRGDKWKSDTDFTGFADWVKLHPWERLTEDFNKRVFPYLESKGIKHIGVFGCCWGCMAVLHICATGKINAGVNFHPTLHLCELTPEQMTEAVTCPQLILPASNDPETMKEGGSLEKILKAKPFGDKCKFRTFPDQVHGFVPRADTSNPINARDINIAMDLAIEFFKANV